MFLGYHHLTIYTIVYKPGDIAIDDVKFNENQQCPGVTPAPTCAFRCGDSSCISADQLCDFVSDCKDNSDESLCAYNCDFDSG